MNIENLLPAPVVAAYEDGRIAESSVAAWVERFRAEPEAAAATLATLAPGLKPGAAPGESAPAVTAREAVEALTGRRVEPVAAAPSPRTHVEPAAAPPMPAPSPGAGFSDADYAIATAALFPAGLPDGKL